MEEAFAVIVVVVAVGGFLIAIATLAGSRSAYEQIGRGSLALDEERPPPPAGTRAAQAESDAEARQMLEARNARRARRGEAPVDVEAELARLRAQAREAGDEPEVDPELRDEVRALVLASNARRARHGRPALDVDAEVERRLREL